MSLLCRGRRSRDALDTCPPLHAPVTGVGQRAGRNPLPPRNRSTAWGEEGGRASQRRSVAGGRRCHGTRQRAHAAAARRRGPGVADGTVRHVHLGGGCRTRAGRGAPGGGAHLVALTKKESPPPPSWNAHLVALVQQRVIHGGGVRTVGRLGDDLHACSV